MSSAFFGETRTIYFSYFQPCSESIDQSRIGTNVGMYFNCTTISITTTGDSQTPPTTSATSYQFNKEKTLAQKTRTQPYSSPLKRSQISSMQLVRTSLWNKDIPEKF